MTSECTSKARSSTALRRIWDADVLIWTTSQIVQARDAGLPTSRRVGATPREILTFIRRGTSVRDYDRLKAALDRLQSTSVCHVDSARSPAGGCIASPGSTSGRNLPQARCTTLGLELILPDWFYAAITDASRVLTIDPAYFELTGGIERWLYRLVRKHADRRRAVGVSTSRFFIASRAASRA